MVPEPANDDEARALRELAQQSPEAVRVERLVDLFVCGEHSTRRAANDAMGALLQQRPNAADAAFSHLVSHLRDDDPDTRRRAALTACVLAAESPGAVQSALEPLLSIATDPAEPGREPALLALSEFAIGRPGDAAKIVGPLLDVAADTVPRHASVTPREPPQGDGPQRRDGMALERTRRDQVRVYAIGGVAQIAIERPEAVDPHRDALYGLLDDDHHLVRAGACEALVGVGQERPEAIDPAVPDLVDLVANDVKNPVPWRAGEALAVACDSDPSAVGGELATATERLRTFLDSPDPQRRRTGVVLVEAVATVDTDAAGPLRQAVQELLDEDDPVVRETAARTLRALEDSA